MLRKLKEIHTATHPAAKLARKAGQERPGDGAEVDRAELLEPRRRRRRGRAL